MWAVCSVYQAQNISTVLQVGGLEEITALTVNNWIMIQQRQDNTTNFTRDWNDYKHGFGDIGGSYWMGNEQVHILTSSAKYKLRLEMRSDVVGWVSAEYSSFVLENATNYYKLHIAGFSGDCVGDSMQHPGYAHNGMQFTTYDSDNDMATDGNCAIIRGGGWWYNNCEWANFNGYYYSHLLWWDIPYPGQYLNVTRMMIKLV